MYFIDLLEQKYFVYFRLCPREMMKKCLKSYNKLDLWNCNEERQKCYTHFCHMLWKKCYIFNVT